MAPPHPVPLPHFMAERGKPFAWFVWFAVEWGGGTDATNFRVGNILGNVTQGRRVAPTLG